MSVFRFKSRTTGDLLMLEQHGQRMLKIVGKDPSRPGIILPEQMAGAVQALQAAALQEEAEQKRLREEAQACDEAPPEFEHVSLHTRSLPLIQMLQQCEQDNVEIVWGV